MDNAMDGSWRTWMLLISGACYVSLPFIWFWSVSSGRVDDFLLALALIAGVLPGLLILALRRYGGRRRPVMAAGLVALQVLCCSAGAALGRWSYTSQVTARLPEYQSIVDRAKIKLSSSKSKQVQLSEPHPDVVVAHARDFPNGGLEVRLVLRDSRAALYFVSGHELPPHEHGACLEALTENWLWYRACS